MEQNFHGFSREYWEKLLRNPETQALISRLQQLDSQKIEQAVQKAAEGDTDGAKNLLRPIMEDTEVARLTNNLRNEHG